jgi:hypothetical protein
MSWCSRVRASRAVAGELTKGQQCAERPGLVCFGKESSYAGSDSWNEVF